MSIVTSLRRQELINQKNNLEYNLLRDSANMRNKMIDKDTTSDSVQLQAVNAELKALKEHDSKKSNRLNYLA